MREGTEKIVIMTSTEPRINGYWTSTYKGIVQGQTWGDLLRNAEQIGANAILNTCFDSAIGIDTLFHGSAVVVKPARSALSLLRRPVRRKIPQPQWSHR